MRNLILSTLILLCSILNAKAQGTAVDAYGQLGVSGVNLVDESNTPVQLQGMSLFWSQWEGSYYRKEVVQQMRDDWCTNIIRASMGVEDNGGYLTSGPNKIGERAKVEAVVDAAIELGMYVIIDWHSHHAEDYTDEATEFFAAMAQKYGQYPNVLYEIYNEPLQVSWSNVIKPYCEEVIDTIRKYDSDNIIICGTPNWCQKVDDAAADPITGETNIMYTLHYYAGTHGSWLRTRSQAALNSGLPLFVTEFGTVEANGDGAVAESAANAWFDFLDQNKISYCNWSLCDKDEGASVLQPFTTWDEDYELNLTASGQFMYDRFTNNCPVYNIDGPPIITSQPESIIEQEGKNVMFRVSASGKDMTYQWTFNGGDIPNADGSTLTVSNITTADEGSYAVVITNVHGSVTSESVTLSILPEGPYNGAPFDIPGLIEAEEYDIGARNSTHYDTDFTNDGGAFRTDGVDIAATNDSYPGNYNVGWTATGEWLAYSVDVQTTAMYDVEFRVAAATGFGGALSLRFDDVNITGNISIPATGGWNTYSTVIFNDVPLGAGEQVMKMYIEQAAFNINHMRFIMQSGTDIDNDNDGVPAAKDCDDEDPQVGNCTLSLSSLISDEVAIYPSPFVDQFQIHAKGEFEVSIYDLTGKILFSGVFHDNASLGGGLPSGAYVVNITGRTLDKTVKVIKF